MTMTLTYNGDLSRVQVSVTDLPFATGTIRIERSTNQMYWEDVRGASELPVSGSAATVDDFEFSADVENFYRVVPVDPVAGLHLDGTAGTYASTPDDPSLRITGDIDLRVDATTDDWSTAQVGLIGRWDFTGDNRSYLFSLDAEGDPRQWWSTDGAVDDSQQSGVPLPVQSGRQAVKSTLDVDNGSSEHVVEFSTAATIDGNYGTHTTHTDAGVVSIFAGTADLEIGSWNAGGNGLFDGVIHAAQVRDGIAGTLVADPRFEDQLMNATSFTDSTGKLWTIHGAAYIVGTETDSITPNLDGKVWLKSIRYPFLNRWIEVKDWSEIGRASRGSLHEAQGRSVPIAVTDVRASQEFTLEITTRDFRDSSFDPLVEARDLDLIIASGGTFFIHVPAALPVPGGYVAIGDTEQGPIASRRVGIDTEVFTLPCRVTAAPGPGVVGGTMTYGALLDLYGGYNNVLAANPTYAAVLALMASLDDLVVL